MFHLPFPKNTRCVFRMFFEDLISAITLVNAMLLTDKNDDQNYENKTKL